MIALALLALCLGVALLVAEAHVPSGVLGVLGIAALVGSGFLFRDAGVAIPLPVILVTAGALGGAAPGRVWSCRVAGGAIHLSGLPPGTPVELRDLAGRCVTRTRSDGLAFAFDAPHGPAGIYLLTCWLPSGPSTLKIALR
ncbi:MAG: hypothetical protein ACO3YQ_05025 [Flavobacteriales bacterium]